MKRDEAFLVAVTAAGLQDAGTVKEIRPAAIALLGEFAALSDENQIKGIDGLVETLDAVTAQISEAKAALLSMKPELPTQGNE